MKRDQWRVRVGASLLAAVLGLIAIPAQVEAQYFGRNKVQYDKLRLRDPRHRHFDIYYYPKRPKPRPRSRAAWPSAGTRGCRACSTTQLTGRQPIVLYASHPDFEQTNVVEGVIGEGTGGVTEGAKRRVVLPMAATLADTDHVLGHELVHAFQYDMLGPNIGVPAALVHRGHGGVPVARPRDAADGDVAARRGDREPAADDQEPRRPALLPVSLRPRVLGVHRRPLRRRSGRPDPRRAGAVERRGGRAPTIARSRRDHHRPATGKSETSSPPSGTRRSARPTASSRARRRRRSRPTRCSSASAPAAAR